MTTLNEKRTVSVALVGREVRVGAAQDMLDLFVTAHYETVTVTDSLFIRKVSTPNFLILRHA